MKLMSPLIIGIACKPDNKAVAMVERPPECRNTPADNLNPMRITVKDNRITVCCPLGIATARCRAGDQFDLNTGIGICLKRLERRYKQRGNRE